MNSFFEHHKDSISGIIVVSTTFCLIQPFRQPERVVGFFNTYRQIYRVTRSTLREIAVAVILKACEPARIMIAIGDKAANRWHLQIAERRIVQYNFYINDLDWGRMFVRILLSILRPYLPQSAPLVANRLRENGIQFKQCSNAFLKCAAPDRLQELADSLTPRDLVTCGQKWLAHLTPFVSAREREQAAASTGCSSRRSSSATTSSSGHARRTPA